MPGADGGCGAVWLSRWGGLHEGGSEACGRLTQAAVGTPVIARRAGMGCNRALVWV